MRHDDNDRGPCRKAGPFLCAREHVYARYSFDESPHHIFPKAFLKSEYTAREADDIANLAFIAGKTNRQISDTDPTRYISTLLAKSGSSAFEAQCIPTDPALLGIKAYKQFLDERRRLISERLNEFLRT